MAFDITLYTIQKRNNSTKQPSGSSKTLTGVLRDSCDVINPIIGFSFAGPYNQQLGRPVPMTAEFNPTDYNYAIIEEFKRSYFIESWEWNGGLWWAHMSVDVLGTYKEDIENHEFYISRAAADYDPNIVDTLYIPKISTTPQVYPTPYDLSSNFTTTFKEGFIVYQILGADANGSFYLATVEEWGYILNTLYPKSDEDLSVILSKLYQQAVVGSTSTVMNNIISVMWLPLKPSAFAGISVTATPLYLGQYYTGHQNAAKLENLQNILFQDEFHFQKRTSPINRGEWIHLEPFSEYTLYLPPFGNIAMDGGKLLANDFWISVDYDINILNGQMVAKIFYGKKSATNRSFHSVLTTQIGITLKSNGQSLNLSNNFDSVINGINNLGNSSVTFDKKHKEDEIKYKKLGAESTAIAGIGSFAMAGIDAFSQRAGSSIISSTTLSPTFDDKVQTISIFYDIVDENNEEWGKPLCKRQTPITTGNGYMVCADGDIDIAGATKGELNAISSFMTSGWFYE